MRSGSKETEGINRMRNTEWVCVCVWHFTTTDMSVAYEKNCRKKVTQKVHALHFHLKIECLSLFSYTSCRRCIFFYIKWLREWMKELRMSNKQRQSGAWRHTLIKKSPISRVYSDSVRQFATLAQASNSFRWLWISIGRKLKHDSLAWKSSLRWLLLFSFFSWCFLCLFSKNAAVIVGFLFCLRHPKI